MTAYLTEWLELLLRWFHVVAGIAWIGESFYFVMQDQSLKAPKDARAIAAGVAGELWSVHGGGFYHAQKYAVAPGQLPDDLHWSKWKSYATWISGFLLLTALYLAQPGTYLIDPSVAALTPLQADLSALAFLAAGWIMYDWLCRLLPRQEGVLGGAMLAYVAAAAFVATHVFSGRAAFLMTGAMLATIMSANVFFVIIPGQRRMVASLTAGTAPDPADGLRGKQRSTHNTYFTLPVVFAMISNHYAMTYSFAQSWAVLVLIMAAGALTRQFFVLWHSGTRAWALPLAGAAMIAGVAAWLAPPAAIATAGGAHVRLADIQPIIVARCVPCHASHPRLMASAPAGLMLETPAEILANGARIEAQAVQLKAMPLGNLTHITPEERNLIGAWYASGMQP
jgi:uncharacterized membrane protein